jgi:hypothetical protein
MHLSAMLQEQKRNQQQNSDDTSERGSHCVDESLERLLMFSKHQKKETEGSQVGIYIGMVLSVVYYSGSSDSFARGQVTT